MIVFRPLPGLTVAAVISLAILLTLGTWQLQRRAEKHDLLAQIAQRQAMPPAPVELLLPVGDYAVFRPATAFGTFLNASESYVIESRADTGPTRPGFRVMTPFRLTGGDIILVDRGWVSADLKDPAMRKQGQVEGETEIEGSLRRPSPASSFTPPPDTGARTFYARNTLEIARIDAMTLRTPLLFEATSRAQGGPAPLPTAVKIPDNHLNYAITWYALAVVLIVIYLVYHRQLGRLGARKQ